MDLLSALASPDGGDHSGGGVGHGDGHGGHGGHHMHPFVPVLYPVIALIVGAATHQLLTRLGTSLPYTVVVLVEGFIWAELTYINKANLDLESQWGLAVESTDAWIHIDGHVLLYAFLPALLFGDSMGLNFHLIKKCLFQSALLAGPGVVLGTFLGSLVVVNILPYGLTLPQGMMIGTILAATDPVAVVSLLKEAGVRPKITMIIAGESLMNDGVAIVLYLFFQRLVQKASPPLLAYQTQTTTGAETMAGIPALDDLGGLAAYAGIFFLEVGIGGLIWGFVSGFIFVKWLRRVDRKGSHGDLLVQLSITLACAYFTFFVGEAMLHVSGVLATVTSAIVVGSWGWPKFLNRKHMTETWHMFEFMFNTILFFLSGSILAGFINESSKVTGGDGLIGLGDFFWLIVMYIMAHVIRWSIVWLFYPALSHMGFGLSRAEAGVMVWGGLRGAVGLALAIDVQHMVKVACTADVAAEYEQDCKDLLALGAKTMFHVGGFALLTLLVNGMTFAWFLEWMGFMVHDDAKEALVGQVEAKLAQACYKKFEEATSGFHDDDKIFAEKIKEKVHILHLHKEDKAEAEIDLRAKSKVGIDRMTKTVEPSTAVRLLFLRILRQEYIQMQDNGLTLRSSSLGALFIESVDRGLNKLDSLQKTDGFNMLHFLVQQFQVHKGWTGLWNCATICTPKSWGYDEYFFNKNLAFHTDIVNQHKLTWCLMNFIEAVNKALSQLISILESDAYNSNNHERGLIPEIEALAREGERLLLQQDPLIIGRVLITQIVVVVQAEQAKQIETYLHSGMLDATDAHHMLEHIDEEFLDLLAEVAEVVSHTEGGVNITGEGLADAVHGFAADGGGESPAAGQSAAKRRQSVRRKSVAPLEQLFKRKSVREVSEQVTRLLENRSETWTTFKRGATKRGSAMGGGSRSIPGGLDPSKSTGKVTFGGASHSSLPEAMSVEDMQEVAPSQRSESKSWAPSIAGRGNSTWGLAARFAIGGLKDTEGAGTASVPADGK